MIKAAEIYANATKGIIVYGTGLTQQANGTANVQALANLALLTGHVGKPGTGILPLMLANNMQGAMDMGLMPEFLPGHQAVTDSRVTIALEQAWNCSLPAEPGLTLQEMIDAAGEKIHALYVVGENLAWSAPDSQRTAQQLSGLDFLVVQDLFMTETSQLAHAVLPAVSYAEKDGTFTNTERRVQRVRKAIQPLGQSLPDYEIITMLANELGASFRDRQPAEVFVELSAVVPGYGGLGYDILDAPGGMRWPLDGHNGSLPTGKKEVNARSYIEMSSHRTMSELPDEEYPFTLIVGRTGVHRVTGTMVTRSFTLNKEAPASTVEINTDDAREMKIRSGWPIRIKTRRGEVTRTVVVTRAVPPKTLFVPIHHKDGLTLALVNSVLEPQSRIPEMKVCAAKLETL